MKNKVSVVVTSYRDRGNLKAILDRWLSFGVYVYLADGSPGGLSIKSNSPNLHCYFYSPDPGNKIRFATASLTTTPYVILADDDVMPEPGFIEDFLYWKETKKLSGLLGIIGRKFTQDNYWKCPFVRADKQVKPIQTGFIGVVYFTERRYLQMDLSGIKNRAIDDLYWQMEAYPNIKKWVIPTNKYKNLPECNDSRSIFKTPESKLNRQEYFKKMYRRNYDKKIIE